MGIVLKDTNNLAPAATLLLGGDFCPIRRYEEKILKGQRIFDRQLLDTFAEKDLFIVNLETPLCNDYHNPGRYGGGLGAAPEIAQCLKNFSIDAVGLANNHILDKERRGLEQTLRVIEQAGIRHFGAGLDLANAEKEAVFSINSLKIGILAVAERELNIAGSNSPGAAPFDPWQTARKISVLKDHVDYLICYPHIGHEFMLTPSPRIRDACRRLVIAGANAVVAHHPHVPQGYEQYQDGWIFYSLGNLIFDSPYVSSYLETDHGYLVKLIIGRHTTDRVELFPYRLTPQMQVEAIIGEEENEYADFLHRLNSLIVNDGKFMEEWEANVTMRWKQDYQEILRNLSMRYNAGGDLPFLNNLRNLFSCPTHQELLNHAFGMIEAEKLQR